MTDEAVCRSFPAGGCDMTELTDQAARVAARTGGVYRVRRGGVWQEREWAADVATAAAACAACPLLSRCRLDVLTGPEVAGYAAGMTEAERARWRRGRADRYDTLDWLAGADVRVGHINEDTEANPPRTPGEVPAAVHKAITRLLAQGLTAEEVVDRLPGVRSGRGYVTFHTVKYVAQGRFAARQARAQSVAS